MICSNWIFIFPLISLVISKELSSPSINLLARYSSENLILVCDLQSNTHSYIFLTCPFKVGHICFTNCESNCDASHNCLPMITNCSTERINKDHFRIKWSIDVTQVNNSGDWKCSHRNINSNTILLEKFIPKIHVANFTKPSQKIETKTLQNFVTFPSQLEIEVPNVPEKKLYYHNTRNDFWHFITKPNIVLILVCVFTISLVMNIIFLIRCALFRSVIDNYLKAKKTPNSCLFRCFCIPVKKTLPPVDMKTLHQSNQLAYAGYHRDEIYDDMSSGSQADRHLINNYSHYDLEHDSMMSRKVWSTDGSHNVVNRQSHICPGQPVGNYVIVTGPVCTNRNHIPLNTPSNASLASNSQHTYTTDAMNRSLSNEFQRPEYCTGTDNVIYSQPMKNRTKSFDRTYNDEVSIKYMQQNCKRASPPPPPERCSVEQTHHINIITDPTPINTVDLIEHYTNSTTAQLTEDQGS